MDFFSNLVAKVGGEDALNLVNDKLTPLLLDSFKPRISEYVNTHVERTRGELFQQLPDGVRNVLNDIVPGGLNSQRGLSDISRGFMDDLAEQIRRKLDKILDETRQRVREVVQNVTSSTSDRVTRSVVEIAQNKLKLKTRAIQNGAPSGESSRGFNFGGSGGSGDFIDNFINSSMEEVRPVVRGELKSVYDHIIDLVPQDARKILVSLVPGLEDNQGSQRNDQSYQNNPSQQYNAPQGFPQGNEQNYQQNSNQQYSNAPFGFHVPNSQSQQYNSNQQFNNAPRELPQDNEVRSRGFMSDLKNFAHQVKDTVKNELKVGGMDGNRGGAELLQEFQAKALDKISKITTELMNQLEGTIMATVSEELRSVAKNKLANKLAF